MNLNQQSQSEICESRTHNQDLVDPEPVDDMAHGHLSSKSTNGA